MAQRSDENRPLGEEEMPVSPSDPLLPSDLIHDVFFCCCPQPVLKCAKAVAYLSLLSLAVNLLTLLMSSRDPNTMSLLIDLGIFGVEFLSIVSLFYGVTNRSANYLRPYLTFGLIWNLSLFVLWVFCVIKLLHRREAFVLKILWNTSDMVALSASHRSAGTWLSILLLIGLACVICIGFFFVHIVLLSYLFLRRREKFAWAAEALDAKQALLEDGR